MIVLQSKLDPKYKIELSDDLKKSMSLIINGVTCSVFQAKWNEKMVAVSSYQISANYEYAKTIIHKIM
jgi:hypothetical protein